MEESDAFMNDLSKRMAATASAPMLTPSIADAYKGESADLERWLSGGSGARAGRRSLEHLLPHFSTTKN